MNNSNENQLIKSALNGDKVAMEALINSVSDMVFNLSLRMLGMRHDAEDATQEILLKVIAALPAFRMESKLSTWVFRIALNYLKDYKKGMFAMHPLSFEIYGEDISSGREKDIPDMSGGIDRAMLEEELKMSCTNVMLQCFDSESRCVYILGTMFGLNSKTAGEILDITPEAYRQKLSRLRKKMAEFLGEYCQFGGSSKCSCAKRVDYAIQTHRINPSNPDYQSMKQLDKAKSFTEAMEQLDGLTQVFEALPSYSTPDEVKSWINDLIVSKPFSEIISQ
ncbi:ECF RNA polymerase sigma factor SigW [Clostridiales bacterium]|nr:ECF RNA polymerase sigma factor SigW [Clostridiales bacterium]